MNIKLPAAAALVAAMALGSPANAGQVGFQFNGAGYSGSGVFTFVPNVSPADPNPSCGTLGNNPCRADPPGAYAITGITGSFTDAGLGLANAAITGLLPIHPTNERDAVFAPLVPSSLSYFDFTHGSLTYNNLFFPDGNPIDCDYPFYGTFLDVFGMAFTIAGGYTADLWGQGDVPGVGLTFGFVLTDGTDKLINDPFGDVPSNVTASVPEPSSLAVLATGLLGALAWRRRSNQK